MADSSIGYGQANPWDFSHPTNAIAFAVRQMMARMETNRIVQVKAVHYTGGGAAGAIAKAGTVDVLPLVNQIDGQSNSTAHGTVYGVPWFRLQGGKNAVIIDPEVGDIGYVAVDARDISNVKRTGKQSNPGSFRMFDLADGIYAGGILNAVPTQYLAFADHKIDLLDANGNHLAFSATGVDVTPKSGQPVTMHGDAIVTGNETIQGNAHVQGTSALDGKVTAGGEVDVVGPLVIAGGATIKRVLGPATLNTSGSIGGTTSVAIGTIPISGVVAGDLVLLSSTIVGNFIVPQYNSVTNAVNFFVTNPSPVNTTYSWNTSILVIGVT